MIGEIRSRSRIFLESYLFYQMNLWAKIIGLRVTVTILPALTSEWSQQTRIKRRFRGV